MMNLEGNLDVHNSTFGVIIIVRPSGFNGYLSTFELFPEKYDERNTSMATGFGSGSN